VRGRWELLLALPLSVGVLLEPFRLEHPHVVLADHPRASQVYKCFGGDLPDALFLGDSLGEVLLTSQDLGGSNAPGGTLHNIDKFGF